MLAISGRTVEGGMGCGLSVRVTGLNSIEQEPSLAQLPGEKLKACHRSIIMEF